jgi:hypothetical protein
MTQSIKDQIEQFVGGFEDVIPRRFTEGLDAKGLGLKLSGLKYIDGTIANKWKPRTLEIMFN